ncbi:MAG: hypothetical protein V2I40_13300 [Desulfobacteraceae bacterium]|nr:hypothetical protein [Desulfobacteraceae bacterium]
MPDNRFGEETHAWRQRRIKMACGQPTGLDHGRARRSLCTQDIDG